MPEPLLVLRLEGPLQSWGERARWDQRDSLNEPTKSGVLGMLGAALGVRRDEVSTLRALDRMLRMGVRVEREGTVLDDYHTITGYLPTAAGKVKKSSQGGPATVLSERRYLEDASFLVMLASRAPEGQAGLQRCAAALQNPYWPLFLGRRSCVPARPVLVELTQSHASLEDALAMYPWSCLAEGGTERTERVGDGSERRLRIVLEDESGASSRQDVIEGSDARLYGRRSVREYWTSMSTQERAS